MPGIQSDMSVKIEWSEEYEGLQCFIKGLYSWVESMFIFCKSQRNIKSNQVVWEGAVFPLEVMEWWTQQVKFQSIHQSRQ